MLDVHHMTFYRWVKRGFAPAPVVQLKNGTMYFKPLDIALFLKKLKAAKDYKEPRPGGRPWSYWLDEDKGFITLAGVRKELGLSSWKIKRWMKCEFIPPPSLIDRNGVMLFDKSWLERVRDIFSGFSNFDLRKGGFSL